MSSETSRDGPRLPDGWPDTFPKPSLGCNHQFHWDTAVHVYYCIYCEAEREQPPKRYVQMDTDQNLRTDGGVDVDGGRQAFLAGDAHYCDICERQFQTLVELIKHNCEQSGAGTTIRGPDPKAFAEWEESR